MVFWVILHFVWVDAAQFPYPFYVLLSDVSIILLGILIKWLHLITIRCKSMYTSIPIQSRTCLYIYIYLFLMKYILFNQLSIHNHTYTAYTNIT